MKETKIGCLYVWEETPGMRGGFRCLLLSIIRGRLMKTVTTSVSVGWFNNYNFWIRVIMFWFFFSLKAPKSLHFRKDFSKRLKLWVTTSASIWSLLPHFLHSHLQCSRLRRARCCIFPVPQIFGGKYKDTWSRSRATNTDRLLPEHTPSVCLSAFPHFLFSCHSLCCHLHLAIRHTHSAFLWFPLFPSSFTSLSEPLYYHQRPIWPTLYELQLKMMSLIIWVEIMWLSFPLCVSPGPCVHAHISLCALHCVCAAALHWCPHYHFQTKVGNQLVGWLLLKLLPHCCFHW